MRYRTIATLATIMVLLFSMPRVDAASADAGAIGNFTDILCMDKTETSVEMTVENLREASLGSGQRYAYLLISVGEDDSQTVIDTIKTNTPSMSFDFSPAAYPTISLPAVFYLKRIASINGYIWMESAGKCTFTVSQNEYTSETVYVCTNDLPTTGTYTYFDGREDTYVLRDDSLEVTFYDRTELGCIHQHTISCVLIDIPEVEVGHLGNVCQSDDKISIEYIVTRGNPTSCHITFGEEAKADGFQDIDLPLNDDNVLEIPLSSSQRKEYEIFLSFYDSLSTSGCSSNVYKRTFTPNLDGFIHEKWDDVLFVDNNDKNCEPDCENELRFTAFQWYKNGKAVDGATEQVYYEEGGLNGVYYVMLTDTEGNEYRSCEIERRPVRAQQIQMLMHVTPVPAQANETITIETTEAGTVYISDIMGRTVDILTARNGVLTTQAPTMRGLYVVSFNAESGERDSQKLIVR